MGRSWLAFMLLLIAGTLTNAEERSAPAYQEHQDLSYYLAENGEKKKVDSRDDWQIRRQHILAQVQTVMGPLPKPEKPVPLDVQELETVTEGKLIRKKISYHTDSKDRRVHAYLLMPADLKERRPAVLCLHSTTPLGKAEPAGQGPRTTRHYARQLAERGYITLSPDYPSFGDYQYDFPAADGYLSGSMKAIYDNTRAIDVLESLPLVDKERIGCIGHSLGGHNSIFTAVFEPRIKAIVSNCGFTRFHKYYGGKLAGWTSARYMPLIATKYQNNPDLVPFDFPELLAALAPRPMLAIAPTRDDNFEVSGVKDCIASAKPIYKLFDAEENLQAMYPVAAHDFPDASREAAYSFVDKHLRDK